MEPYSVVGVATALLHDGTSAVIPTEGRPVRVLDDINVSETAEALAHLLELPDWR